MGRRIAVALLGIGVLSLSCSRNFLPAQQAASGAVTEASSQAAWHTIPSWYLVAKQDHAIAPDLERFMAARAHAHTVESDGSHSVMVSHPDTVAQLIETAARSTR